MVERPHGDGDAVPLQPPAVMARAQLRNALRVRPYLVEQGPIPRRLHIDRVAQPVIPHAHRDGAFVGSYSVSDRQYILEDELHREGMHASRHRKTGNIEFKIDPGRVPRKRLDE